MREFEDVVKSGPSAAQSMLSCVHLSCLCFRISVRVGCSLYLIHKDIAAGRTSCNDTMQHAGQAIKLHRNHDLGIVILKVYRYGPSQQELYIWTSVWY